MRTKYIPHVLSLLTIVGCSHTPTDEVPTNESNPGITLSAVPQAVVTGPCVSPGPDVTPGPNQGDSPLKTTVGLYMHWQCGHTIYLNLTAVPTSWRSDVQAAVIEYNQALDFPRTSIIKLVTSNAGIQPPYSTVSVSMPTPPQGATGASGWCGTFSPLQPKRPNAITLTYSLTKNCGSLYGVMLQELSGIVGYVETWDSGAGAAGAEIVAGINDHCARTLGSNELAHDGLCMHELEGVWEAYGVRSPADHLTLFAKHIVTSLGLTATIKIPVGGSQVFTLGGSQAERANPALCGGPGCTASIPATDLSLTWAAASGNPSGLLTMTPGSNGRTLTINAGTTIGSGGVVATITDALHGMGTFMERNQPVQVLGRQLAIVAGNGQSAPAGSVLPIQPKVKLTRTDGVAIPGANINFTASGGGSVSQATVVTNQAGEAATTWTLGATPGSNGLTVSSPYVTPNLVFSATGTGPLPTVTSFTYTDCSSYLATNGKTYNTFTLSWTLSSTPPSSVTYQIGENTTNNSVAASVAQQGTASAGITTLGGDFAPLAGPYLKGTVSNLRYWWVRVKDATTTGPWRQLAAPKFPMETKTCFPPV